jgi:hypothetical protein
MRWQVKHRLDFIRMTLERMGCINRADIMREYGVSAPQASADLSLFQREHPNLMEYDLSQKTYRLRAHKKKPERGGDD